MTRDALIKKIARNYTIEIDGKRYITEGSIPSVIEAIINAMLGRDKIGRRT